MNRITYQKMMQGLMDTAEEKVCVAGFEDAQDDLDKIGDMIEDLEMFWNSSQKFDEICWSGVFETNLLKWEAEFDESLVDEIPDLSDYVTETA